MVRIVLAVVMVAAMVGVVGLLVLPLVSAQDGPSATRSFDKTTVEPGGEVVVTIEVANYGRFSTVTETLPSGFTYESSSLTDEIEVTGQEISVVLIGTYSSFTYTVTASSTTGSYRFFGTLSDEESDSYDVGGASSVTVEATAEPTPSATRSFDKTTVEPGGEVVVTIAVANYGQGGESNRDPARRVHLRIQQSGRQRYRGHRPERQLHPARDYFLYVHRYRVQHGWFP